MDENDKNFSYFSFVIFVKNQVDNFFDQIIRMDENDEHFSYFSFVIFVKNQVDIFQSIFKE